MTQPASGRQNSIQVHMRSLSVFQLSVHPRTPKSSSDQIRLVVSWNGVGKFTDHQSRVRIEGRTRPEKSNSRTLTYCRNFPSLKCAYSSFFRAKTNSDDARSRNITTPSQPFVARLPSHRVPTLNVSGFIHPASSSTLMTIASRPMTPPAAINPLE